MQRDVTSTLLWVAVMVLALIAAKIAYEKFHGGNMATENKVIY